MPSMQSMQTIPMSIRIQLAQSRIPPRKTNIPLISHPLPLELLIPPLLILLLLLLLLLLTLIDHLLLQHNTIHTRLEQRAHRRSLALQQPQPIQRQRGRIPCQPGQFIR